MLKALGIGLLALLLGDAIWTLRIVLYNQPSAFFDYLCLGFTFIAGFISTYCAPRWKITMGIAMALPEAILITLINCLLTLVDPTDYPGRVEASMLAVLSFFWLLPFCSAGALSAFLVLRRKTKNTK